VIKFFLLVHFICLLVTSIAQANLVIPYNLSYADRNKALVILGYGSASKILGDPYPLGGYDGLEIGLSSEYLATQQMAALGNGAQLQSQTTYNTLTVGKGIYNNIDTFLSFSLMGQEENFTNLAGQIRWGFFQASYLPIYFSAILHANSFNCENLIVTNTVGLDVIVGFKEGDVTLYMGGGPIRASGNYSGGSGGVTDNGQNMGAGIMDNRFIAGLNIKIGKYFVAGEIDNYSTSAYAAKLGYRF